MFSDPSACVMIGRVGFSYFGGTIACCTSDAPAGFPYLASRITAATARTGHTCGGRFTAATHAAIRAPARQARKTFQRFFCRFARSLCAPIASWWPLRPAATAADSSCHRFGTCSHTVSFTASDRPPLSAYQQVMNMSQGRRSP